MPQLKITDILPPASPRGQHGGGIRAAPSETGVGTIKTATTFRRVKAVTPTRTHRPERGLQTPTKTPGRRTETRDAVNSPSVPESTSDGHGISATLSTPTRGLPPLGETPSSTPSRAERIPETPQERNPQALAPPGVPGSGIGTCNGLIEVSSGVEDSECEIQKILPSPNKRARRGCPRTIKDGIAKSTKRQKKWPVTQPQLSVSRRENQSPHPILEDEPDCAIVKVQPSPRRPLRRAGPAGAGTADSEGSDCDIIKSMPSPKRRRLPLAQRRADDGADGAARRVTLGNNQSPKKSTPTTSKAPRGDELPMETSTKNVFQVDLTGQASSDESDITVGEPDAAAPEGGFGTRSVHGPLAAASRDPSDSQMLRHTGTAGVLSTANTSPETSAETEDDGGVGQDEAEDTVQGELPRRHTCTDDSCQSATHGLELANFNVEAKTEHNSASDFFSPFSYFESSSEEEKDEEPLGIKINVEKAHDLSAKSSFPPSLSEGPWGQVGDRDIVLPLTVAQPQPDHNADSFNGPLEKPESSDEFELPPNTCETSMNCTFEAPVQKSPTPSASTPGITVQDASLVPYTIQPAYGGQHLEEMHEQGLAGKFEPHHRDVVHGLKSILKIANPPSEWIRTSPDKRASQEKSNVADGERRLDPKPWKNTSKLGPNGRREPGDEAKGLILDKIDSAHAANRRDQRSTKPRLCDNRLEDIRDGDTELGSSECVGRPEQQRVGSSKRLLLFSYAITDKKETRQSTEETRNSPTSCFATAHQACTARLIRDGVSEHALKPTIARLERRIAAGEAFPGVKLKDSYQRAPELGPPLTRWPRGDRAAMMAELEHRGIRTGSQYGNFWHNLTTEYSRLAGSRLPLFTMMKEAFDDFQGECVEARRELKTKAEAGECSQPQGLEALLQWGAGDTDEDSPCSSDDETLAEDTPGAGISTVKTRSVPSQQVPVASLLSPKPSPVGYGSGSGSGETDNSR